MNSTGYQSKPAASLRLEVKSTLDAARAGSIRVRQFLKDFDPSGQLKAASRGGGRRLTWAEHSNDGGYRSR